ncbi:MAG: acyl-CoA thioesterase [Actinomycetota bacterium]|nr:acyl-CoA thioesterase [Actinomycetota bacterium]
MVFSTAVTVPYYQVDQQGVVFNMWYLAWFDDAMTAYLADIGYAYDTMNTAGLDAQLVHVDVDWKSGVRFGDQVEVQVSTQSVGSTSFCLLFTVRSKTAVHATARSVYVVIALSGAGKVSVPAALRAALTPAN